MLKRLFSVFTANEKPEPKQDEESPLARQFREQPHRHLLLSTYSPGAPVVNQEYAGKVMAARQEERMDYVAYFLNLARDLHEHCGLSVDEALSIPLNCCVTDALYFFTDNRNNRKDYSAVQLVQDETGLDTRGLMSVLVKLDENALKEFSSLCLSYQGIEPVSNWGGASAGNYQYAGAGHDYETVENSKQGLKEFCANHIQPREIKPVVSVAGVGNDSPS